MNRSSDYSQGKRQKEQQLARKQQEKAARRQRKREQGTAEPEIATTDQIVGRLPSIDEAMRAIETNATIPRAVGCASSTSVWRTCKPAARSRPLAP
jgi:hypothetical protein